MPARFTTTKLFICTLLGALWPAGCATVDPKADVQRTSSLVTERTGSAEVYDPLADELAAEKVERLLAGGLTIDQAVQVALLNNPAFQAMFAEIGASRADVVQSGLLSNPTVSVALMFPEGGGRSRLTAGFAQQIVDLWQIPVRKKIAEDQLEQTILSVAQRAVEQTAEVKNACYQLLALEQVIAVQRENRELADQSMQLVRRQYEAGLANQFDVNLARVSVLDVDTELIQLERDREVARSKLARLLGLSRYEKPWQLADKIPLPDAIGEQRTLCEFAIQKRFDAAAATFQVRSAEEELRLAALKVFPDLSLGTDMERMESRALPRRHILADTARESIAAGRLTAPSIQSRAQRAEEKRMIIDLVLGPSLSATLPIWDQNQAQIAKARFRAVQARKKFEDLLDQVYEEVQQTSQTARSDRQLLKFYNEQLLPQLQANVEASRQIYLAGQQSVLVLLDAQRSLVSRRKDYVNVLRDYALAMADLERAVGGRLPSSTTTAPASAPAASGPARP